MKIGGGRELLMVVGPLVAGAMIVLYVTDASDLLRQAERLLSDSWTTVVAAFRR
jgi:hypothetical protein